MDRADYAGKGEERDEDLVRWARQLGVTYEELRSTLNYAGPTFKDRARLAGEIGSPPTRGRPLQSLG